LKKINKELLINRRKTTVTMAKMQADKRIFEPFFINLQKLQLDVINLGLAQNTNFKY
jgi:hypothetical protein